MNNNLRALVWCGLFGGFVLATGAPGVQVEAKKDQPAKPAQDAWGDPLPDGVLLRIGTTRLRHASGITALQFSRDGASLASGGGGTVRLWNTSTGKQLLAKSGEDVVALDFSPDGKALAASSRYGHVRIWNPSTGALIQALAGHISAGATGTQAIRISPDGKLLTLADSDGNVFLREIATGKQLKKLRVNLDHWFRIGLSADGKVATTAGTDHVVCIWDVASGKSLLKLPAHKNYTNAAVFSPDGRYLVSGGQHHSHLWELATGQLVYTLPSFDTTFAFAPDGRTLASCALCVSFTCWR